MVLSCIQDASHQDFGCVIIQHGKFVAYVSRQLKEYKKNYLTHDLELVAVFSLKNLEALSIL